MRIDEIMHCQRTLWEIIDDKSTGPRARVEAIGKLLNCTDALIALYDCLPLINAIRDWGCGYDHDKDKPRPLYQSTIDNHQDDPSSSSTF
jgi:hypothetical protein